jgi:hypothetical protein
LYRRRSATGCLKADRSNRPRASAMVGQKRAPGSRNKLELARRVIEFAGRLRSALDDGARPPLQLIKSEDRP